MSSIREVKQVFNGLKASDGDGVQLTRIIGTPYIDMLDPFLLLDAFGSDKPQDYIGGFPAHPHRGFETVTYMLEGKMRHKDSAGNEGIIETGGVQWMTAGKGIIHSEMPEQIDGMLAGFQLWVNLPASHKMSAPKYQEKTAAEIPVENRSNGTSIKVIAGATSQGTQGIIVNDFVSPTYWDVSLEAEQALNEAVNPHHNAFVYLMQGSIEIGDTAQIIEPGQIAILDFAEVIKVSAREDSRFLVIAGKPLNEPVARGGPFVMNTREELNQAYLDYQSGNFI
ncbi:pirin family protein [Aliikangiella marina]|uniref:Pirin family protein n=1 Tax=Aliikangiella marina TaxID=1712262 RepID=A0A545TCM8_9GAMM|nr:pirin family protein [Aliikangiella marina]TQV74965.1 pirin family protein [Aliikangiella marina]